MTNSSLEVLHQGTEEYETTRRANINPLVAQRFPHSIWVVQNERDVITALEFAKSNRKHVGVRSGGHTFHHSPLLQGGILIDTTHLNRSVDYDLNTREVSFGPAVQVKEISDILLRHGRFFAHGHYPTVAAGGFLLAGGQGFFMRGWGATVQQWITKIRVVTSEGKVVTASRTENQDLFWAARGSGTAFFGVVTRFWARTIPAEQLFVTSHTFEVGNKYKELLEWAFAAAANTPKYGTDITLLTYYKENFDTTLSDDSVPPGARLMLGVAANAYTGSLAEASRLLSAFTTVPASLESNLVESKPTSTDTWDNTWALQDALFGPERGLNWQINSILSHPKVPLAELVRTIKPAVCELPTRFSMSAICPADVKADESDSMISIPQPIYVSTFTAWRDEALTPHIGHVMRRHYRNAGSVAGGMYIADYDPNCDDANVRAY